MRTITIRCSGGLVQDVEDVPAGIAVRVIDYDCEGCPDCQTDEAGDRCHISTYEGEEALPTAA